MVKDEPIKFRRKSMYPSSCRVRDRDVTGLEIQLHSNVNTPELKANDIEENNLPATQSHISPRCKEMWRISWEPAENTGPVGMRRHGYQASESPSKASYASEALWTMNCAHTPNEIWGYFLQMSVLKKNETSVQSARRCQLTCSYTTMNFPMVKPHKVRTQW